MYIIKILIIFFVHFKIDSLCIHCSLTATTTTRSFSIRVKEKIILYFKLKTNYSLYYTTKIVIGTLLHQLYYTITSTLNIFIYLLFINEFPCIILFNNEDYIPKNVRYNRRFFFKILIWWKEICIMTKWNFPRKIVIMFKSNSFTLIYRYSLYKVVWVVRYDNK